MSRLWRLIAVVAVLLTAGCLESTTTVQLKRDGSGTVTETLYEIQTVRQMMDMLRGLGSALADEYLQRTSADPFMERPLYERRAAAMGHGVSLASLEKVKKRDGTQGVKAIYSFSQVADLSLSPEPNYPPPVPSSAPESNQVARVTFAYDPAVPGKLTVNLPWAKRARAQAKLNGASPPRKELKREEASLVGHVLTGFRARMIIETVPPIINTDASDASNKSIVLYDVALGETVRNERALSRLAGVGAVRDMGEALVKYVDIMGVTVEKKDSVTVSF